MLSIFSAVKETVMENKKVAAVVGGSVIALGLIGLAVKKFGKECKKADCETSVQPVTATVENVTEPVVVEPVTSTTPVAPAVVVEPIVVEPITNTTPVASVVVPAPVVVEPVTNTTPVLEVVKSEENK